MLKTGNLVKAHNELDKAVDMAYGLKSGTTNEKRLELLFEMYERLS